MMTLLLALLLGMEVHALRCDNIVIAPGANKLEVVSACGEPDFRETVSGADAVPEEVWIYDRPRQGVQNLLRFRGVTLAAISNAELAAGLSGGALRCNGKVVSRGTTKLAVQRLCGEPALIERTSGEEQSLREAWLYERDGRVVEVHFAGVQVDEVRWRD